MEPFHDRRRPSCHRLDGRPAVTLGGKRRDVGAGGGRDLCTPDVRGDRRLAQDADVDEQDVAAVLAHPVGEERVLLTLRVQSPDEDDGRHEVGGAGRMRSGPYTARMMRLRIIRARRG